MKMPHTSTHKLCLYIVLAKCFPINSFFRLNSKNEKLDALKFLLYVSVLTNNKWRKNKVLDIC